MRTIKRTLGKIADDILKKKREITKLNEKVKKAEDERSVLEKELQTAADAQNQSSGGGKKSKWKVELETVPQVQDWDEFHKFILKTEWLHLLNRRPTVTACQELWEQGKDIPGVEKFSFYKTKVTEV